MRWETQAALVLFAWAAVVTGAVVAAEVRAARRRQRRHPAGCCPFCGVDCVLDDPPPVPRPRLAVVHRDVRSGPPRRLQDGRT